LVFAIETCPGDILVTNTTSPVLAIFVLLFSTSSFVILSIVDEINCDFTSFTEAQFISPPQNLLLFLVGVPPPIIANNSDTLVQIHPLGDLYVCLPFSLIQYLQYFGLIL